MINEEQISIINEYKNIITKKGYIYESELKELENKGDFKFEYIKLNKNDTFLVNLILNNIKKEIEKYKNKKWYWFEDFILFLKDLHIIIREYFYSDKEIDIDFKISYTCQDSIYGIQRNVDEDLKTSIIIPKKYMTEIEYDNINISPISPYKINTLTKKDIYIFDLDELESKCNTFLLNKYHKDLELEDFYKTYKNRIVKDNNYEDNSYYYKILNE